MNGLQNLSPTIAKIIKCLVCCLVFAMPVESKILAEDPPGVYQAPSEEPTAAETMLLEYVNRCRANPTADAALIKKTGQVRRGVDMEMFEAEMAQFAPAPPLAFDLDLIKAARWHSAYQIKHGQGHDEKPGAAGFSGVKVWDRAEKAGFQSRGIGENIFLQATTPWYCHSAFVVDWGEGGTGGMQPGRGHRSNILKPDWRVAGMGAIEHSGSKMSVTQIFGVVRSNQRMVGGVIYNDANRNRFYDLEEGVGGIGLTVEDSSVKSWASGAYAIPIAEGQHKIEVQVGETTFVSLLPEGNENVKVDVILSDLAQYAQAGKLVEAIKKIPDDEKNSEKRLTVLTNLYLASRNSMVEASVFDEVVELTKDVEQQIKSAMDETREALESDDMKAAKKIVVDHGKTYRRTELAPWFTDAKNSISLVEAFQRLKSTAEKNGKPPTSDVVAKTLRSQQRVFQRLQVPEWRAFGLGIGKQIQQLADQ